MTLRNTHTSQKHNRERNMASIAPHSIQLIRFALVADFRIGFAFQLENFEISYSQVARTPEFRRASDPQIFGSLQLGFKF